MLVMLLNVELDVLVKVEVLVSMLARKLDSKGPSVARVSIRLAESCKWVRSVRNMGAIRQSLFRIPHHAPVRLFEGVACPSASGRDLARVSNQNLQLRNR